MSEFSGITSVPDSLWEGKVTKWLFAAISHNAAGFMGMVKTTSLMYNDEQG